jgi:osmotically-inducible protein OsmY
MMGQDKEEPRKEPSEDSYSGYYWGNEPYDSSKAPGRKTDEDLKNTIKEKLTKSTKVNSDGIEISVNNATVILTGYIKTYEERRLVGEEVWNIPGIIKVLNDLKVTEPETAGPSKQSL